MFFIEADKQNCCALTKEIKCLEPLPKQVRVNVIPENCFDTLQVILDHLSKSGNSMAPAFIFVDPYGFRIPGAILRKFMEFDRVELFVNVIWRELSMAIAQGNKSSGTFSQPDVSSWIEAPPLLFNFIDSCNFT